MATAGFVVGPKLAEYHVEGAGDGEESQVEGSAGVVDRPYGLFGGGVLFWVENSV